MKIDLVDELLAPGAAARPPPPAVLAGGQSEAPGAPGLHQEGPSPRVRVALGGLGSEVPRAGQGRLSPAFPPRPQAAGPGAPARPLGGADRVQLFPEQLKLLSSSLLAGQAGPICL